MKGFTRYHLFLVLLLVLAGLYFLQGRGGAAQSIPGGTRYLRDLTMTSTFLAADFVPDGNLSKKAWKAAHPVVIDHDRFGEVAFPDSEAQVCSLWSAHYLYLAYKCRYVNINTYPGDSLKERPGICDRDVVEAFIDPQPEGFTHYYEYEIAPNNQWWDLEINLKSPQMGNDKWDSHFEHATKLDAEHKIWVVEMRIPVASMNVQAIHPGEQWRLNLYRCDGPGKGDDPGRRFLSWSPLPPGHNGSYHQPACFGIIKFVK
jgi:hypothetical protein